MTKQYLIALDLAKSVIHVAVEDVRHNQITMSKSMTVKRVKAFLVNHPPSTVVMEACGSSHSWCWFAEAHGHEAVLLPTHHVTPYRQGHKTDANDTLAILEAAQRPHRKEAVKKTPEQLELQILLEVRERFVDQKRRLSNAIRSYLLEFGVRLPTGYAVLKRQLMGLLEDAENSLPMRLRHLLYRQYQSLLQAEQQVMELDKELRQVVKTHPPCTQLCQLEAVGPVNAVALYARLGNGQAFRNGRQAAACIGVTPQQFSTGGVAKMGTIRKKHVDKKFRATLLQGAQSVVSKLKRKPPSSDKERWLQALIQRRGERVAAVALVNKNVRTAWAMLSRGEDYQVASSVRG